MEEWFFDNDFVRNCSYDEENMEEDNKENELRICGELNESLMFEYLKGKWEDEFMS